MQGAFCKYEAGENKSKVLLYFFSEILCARTRADGGGGSAFRSDRYERIIDLLSTVGCLDRYVENIPRNIKKMNSVQLLLQEYISSSKIVLDEYVKFIMEEY